MTGYIGLNRLGVNSSNTTELGPVNTGAPVLSGTTEIGEELTWTNGTWEGAGTITYTYTVLRDGVSVATPGTAAYTLVEADEGAIITVRVAATDGNGTRTRTSNSLGPVTDPLALDALLLSEGGDELLLNEGGDPLLLSEAA